MNAKEKIDGMLLGLAVGDALGVPVEFTSRESLQADPVVGMRGHGTHGQPAGTWSDDTSLTLCLVDAMAAGEEDLPTRLATNMVRWVQENFWTPHGHVFDIGIATRQAIRRLATGITPELAGGRAELDNGNGSLMRILPLLLMLPDKSIEERFTWVRRVSSLTHGHIRSVMACFYYLELARLIWQGQEKRDAYRMTNELVARFWSALPIDEAEQHLFDRLLNGRLGSLPEVDIQSSGYVLHTLEASIWCWLTTDTYKDAVLRAVNLGSDTDTTGTVTGGLAGLYYGAENIPAKWVKSLARLTDVQALMDQLGTAYQL